MTIKSVVFISVLETSSSALKSVISSDCSFFKTYCCATNNPRIKPNGLNACAKFSRCVAVSLAPIAKAYGFAAVSKKANPKVNMYKPMQKNQNSSVMAAG